MIIRYMPFVCSCGIFKREWIRRSPVGIGTIPESSTYGAHSFSCLNEWRYFFFLAIWIHTSLKYFAAPMNLWLTSYECQCGYTLLVGVRGWSRQNWMSTRGMDIEINMFVDIGSQDISISACNRSIFIYGNTYLDMTLYSSSPKNTLTGNQASPQTLNRSGRPSNFFNSSGVNSQPSSSKLVSIRSLLTDLGITDQPFCRPHASKTCWGVFPFSFATARSVSSL